LKASLNNTLQNVCNPDITWENYSRIITLTAEFQQKCEDLSTRV